MTAKKRLLPLDNLFTASYNREEEWQRCCAKVMGFEWVDRFDDANPIEPPTTAKIQQLINLTDEVVVLEDQEDECKHDDVDSWTATALRIQTNLQHMAQWIQSKQQEFVGLNMLDTEASIIQSTVTTFAATTASELETLRQLIPSSLGGTVAGHRNGIVQILLGQLQEEITQPFGKLQKQRTRVAVQLWQHPWQCQLVVPKAPSRGSMTHLLDDNSDDEGEKRFLPRTGNPTSRSSIDFWDRYERDPLDEFPLGPKPEFLMQRWDTPGTAPRSAPSSAIQHVAPSHFHQVTTLSHSTTPHSYEELQRQEQVELEQEATLLQETIVQSDLDSVQKMEQRMVEITTLIGQFANLVSEQQEDIQDIAHQAQTTKQNMEKGQENLIDATERTKRSKHYMAWTIFALSLTLLFFHTLRN